MRVVSWNANMKFREKWKILDNYYHADLYIIQECEDPNQCENKDYQNFASNSLWIGDMKSKGLGIFTPHDSTITRLSDESHYLRYMLPFEFEDKQFIGIWACANHIEDLVVYLSINHALVKQRPIIMGDFNSSVIWNKKHKNRTHSVMNNMLQKENLMSAYHEITGDQQGKENIATFYMYRHLNKPYHIDYCYCEPQSILNFEVGQYEFWYEYSDHMPIVIELVD